MHMNLVVLGLCKEICERRGVLSVYRMEMELQRRSVRINACPSSAESRVVPTMPSTITRALHEIVDERRDFVFTTPERLAMPDFLETLRETEIDFVVIDEAHCISQWGHDFRPSYLAIQQALRELDDPPVLALTATATEEVL